MGNLIDKIPEILEKSGNLFSLFALVVLAVAILSYLFYIRSDAREKSRAFLLVLLFFFGLVLAALGAGVFSGFQKGTEATVVRVEQNPSSVNPSLVKLSQNTLRKLESYITSKGGSVTEENKTRVLEEALEAYVTPSGDSSQSPKSSPIQVVTAREFIFELQKCKRASEAVKCELDITNKEKDRVLRLYGKGDSVSRAVDLQGNQYIASYVDFGGARSNQTVGNYVNQTLVQGVRLKAYIVFDNMPPQINQFALLELSAFEEQLFTVQLRTITLVSE